MAWPFLLNCYKWIGLGNGWRGWLWVETYNLTFGLTPPCKTKLMQARFVFASFVVSLAFLHLLGYFHFLATHEQSMAVGLDMRSVAFE